MQADHQQLVLQGAPDAVCGAQSNGVICMQTKSLSVAEFNKIFEDEIERIDRLAGDNIEVYSSGVVVVVVFHPDFFILFVLFLVCCS